MSRRSALLAIGAAGVLTSAFVHYYLYFEGGYRGIAPDDFLGVTISRAFAANAIVGVVLAEALVLSIRFARWTVPVALAGAGFAAATIVAYVASRTVGLLGFEDDQTSTEAVVALVAEVAAVVALGWLLLERWRSRASGPAGPGPVPA